MTAVVATAAMCDALGARARSPVQIVPVLAEPVIILPLSRRSPYCAASSMISRPPRIRSRDAWSKLYRIPFCGRASLHKRGTQ